MNTLESWISVADYEVPIAGGQDVCLFIEQGMNELIVTSRIPYDPKSKDNQACKSKELRLELKSNEDKTFLICPASEGNYYSCGWRIVEHSLGPNPGCEDQR
jgi:hypothetical protein